jgi:hypothetical protein
VKTEKRTKRAGSAMDNFSKLEGSDINKTIAGESSDSEKFSGQIENISGQSIDHSV